MKMKNSYNSIHIVVQQILEGRSWYLRFMANTLLCQHVVVVTLSGQHGFIAVNMLCQHGAVAVVLLGVHVATTVTIDI